MSARKVVIVGAAGRDFHNFNTHYRGKPEYQVVGFTAAQIPGIDDKKYPAELAGDGYPDGIPIMSEDKLRDIIIEHDVDEVAFSYSDVSSQHVLDLAGIAMGAGADFILLGPKATQVRSTKPLVSVCAIRTGVGKSATSRRLIEAIKATGLKAVSIRHPMPYGDLAKQKVQRFATYDDLVTHECTIEEREEYEPVIDQGLVIFAGVDYEAILREAEKEADIILWDGGNNDFPFYKSDLEFVLFDPHRLGHESAYYPGNVNAHAADVAIIAKVDTADPADVAKLKENIAAMNPRAKIVEARFPIKVEEGADLASKRLLVIEDGPTLTHGGMTYGAGVVASRQFEGVTLVDPRPFAVGSIKGTFEKYGHLDQILPAMGYGDEQVKELEATINAVDCDAILAATPIDLTRLVKPNKPMVRVFYGMEEKGDWSFEAELKAKGIIK